MHDFLKKAKEIIEKICYITIATVSKDGQPWNSPVYSTHDDTYNFYWLSWKENQHSQNIRLNNKIFLVIYDSTAPSGTGKGVYLLAKAYELTDEEEITHALSYMYARKTYSRDAKEFQGNFPRRVYKAVPEKVWMNEKGDIDGNFIDKRVALDLLKK